MYPNEVSFNLQLVFLLPIANGALVKIPAADPLTAPLMLISRGCVKSKTVRPTGIIVLLNIFLPYCTCSWRWQNHRPPLNNRMLCGATSRQYSSWDLIHLINSHNSISITSFGFSYEFNFYTWNLCLLRILHLPLHSQGTLLWQRSQYRKTVKSV